jgi:hypothetical protein
VVEGCKNGSYHPDIAVAGDQTAAYIAKAFGLM